MQVYLLSIAFDTVPYLRRVSVKLFLIVLNSTINTRRVVELGELVILFFL